MCLPLLEGILEVIRTLPYPLVPFVNVREQLPCHGACVTSERHCHISFIVEFEHLVLKHLPFPNLSPTPFPYQYLMNAAKC